LPSIRSLHYFLPVIDELPPGPPPDGYLEYLRKTFPDKPTPTRALTPPTTRRRDRFGIRKARQLTLNLGAGPENDVSS
jgi:hypothetical protein